MGVCARKQLAVVIKKRLLDGKYHLWTGQSLPLATAGPWTSFGSTVLAHSLSIRQGSVETMEGIYGSESWRVVSDDLLRLTIKLLLGWQSTCPVWSPAKRAPGPVLCIWVQREHARWLLPQPDGCMPLWSLGMYPEHRFSWLEILP